MGVDVFSRAVRRRNLIGGMTFNRMAAACGWERSSAWWNNMANYRMETPPAPKYVRGIARVLRISERRANELIAEQWYSVRPDDAIPDHLKDLVTLLEEVDPGDLPAVEQLVVILGQKCALAAKVGQYEAEGEAASGADRRVA
ncbi:hypothetical protein ACFY12_21535 [Streptomyces sp. NPDC001339]|uniref:hypothetical protein n=1 Tax=Streptomyces sp. NPDC001339 TaxID=3364563 RepID=UPI0036A30911